MILLEKTKQNMAYWYPQAGNQTHNWISRLKFKNLLVAEPCIIWSERWGR